jgi:endonuclease/exonuclease/phosphatase family metal-dependent hydrolase
MSDLYKPSAIINKLVALITVTSLALGIIAPPSPMAFAAPYCDGPEPPPICDPMEPPPPSAPSAPTGPRDLRVLTWNVAAFAFAGPGKTAEQKTRALGKTIREQRPDIVLLNEVQLNDGLFSNHVDQTALIAQELGWSNVRYQRTVGLGWEGQKGVTILSRYPLVEPIRYHPVLFHCAQVPHQSGTDVSAFGTLEAHVIVNGLRHTILSTRLAPHNGYDGSSCNYQENKVGVRQSLDLVHTMNPREPIIFGGDFNAGRENRWLREFEEDMVNFHRLSGLTDAVGDTYNTECDSIYRNIPVLERQAGILQPRLRSHPLWLRVTDLSCDARVIDFIYFRGPYKVTGPAQRLSYDQLSDHPMIVAELRDSR